MINRRHFTAGAGALLMTPALLRADTRAVETAIASLPQLHSLQIKRGDRLLFASAPRGPGLDRLANIKSCSKSIVALLLGAAIDRQEIPNVHARLGDVAQTLLPETAAPGADAITMQDLVTLRAGLERTSGANYGAWVQSDNWIADALSRPMIATPGTQMLYSTGSTHVLGAALSEVAEQSLLALARSRLGDPLDIDIPAWTRDPQGYYLGGNDMALRPTAMLAIAEMMRDQGRYADRQVIPRTWVQASTRAYTRSRWSGLAYGYGWFLSPSGYILGRGFGGQIIAAHPRENLAIAITSDPTQPARSDGHFGDLMRFLDGSVLSLAQSV